MREIKFRAWDGEKFRESFVVHQANGFPMIETTTPLGSRYLETQAEWTVQQYTGLKDKNGVEIYEGDIIERKYMDIYEIRDENDKFIRWSDYDDKKEHIDHYEIKWIMDTVDLHSEYAELYNGFMAVHTKEHRYSGIGGEFKFKNCGAVGVVASRLEIVGNIFEGVDK